MAVTSSDIINLLKETGMNEKFVNSLKVDVPLILQGMDSIDLPMLAVETEKKYHVDLSDASAGQLKTINDFVDFVNKKIKS
ncbi:MAG: phosphopantetheine-binding protein [Candidatus Eremiobacterota bacterium]